MFTLQSNLAERANKQFCLYTDDDHAVAIYVEWAVEGTLSDPHQRYLQYTHTHTRFLPTRAMVFIWYKLHVMTD